MTKSNIVRSIVVVSNGLHPASLEAYHLNFKKQIYQLNIKGSKILFTSMTERLI